MSPRKKLKSADPEAELRGDMPMEWQHHLEEMRSRLLRTLVVVTVLFFAGFAFSEQIFAFLMLPFKEAFDAGLHLNYSYMGESIVLTMQCALFAALFTALPYIVFEIWGYVKPALSIPVRRAACPLFISGFFLFYLGAAFAFFLLLPASVGMIVRFSKETISSFISSTNYLSFLFTFCAATGALFEMPVALSLLAATGAISPRFLIEKRKYVIVLIWIIAAVMTPPDVLSQALVAIPLMLLYEISLLIVRLIARKKMREAAKSGAPVKQKKAGGNAPRGRDSKKSPGSRKPE